MKRKKIIIVFLAVLIVAAAGVLVNAVVLKNETAQNGSEASGNASQDGLTEEGSLLADSDSESQIQEDESESLVAAKAEKEWLAAECRERYGEPDTGFFEIIYSDELESTLNFDQIRNLKVYYASPTYSEDELLCKLADVLCEEGYTYETSKQGYETLDSGGAFEWSYYKSFGNYYNFYNIINDEEYVFLHGGAYSAGLQDGDRVIGFQAEDMDSFLGELTKNLHLGLWDGEECLMSEVERTDGYRETEYESGFVVDGVNYGILSQTPYSWDSDGAYYAGELSGNIWAIFDDKEYLTTLGGLYSADITGDADLKCSYENFEDIVSIIDEPEAKLSSDMSWAKVYYVYEAQLVYVMGVMDDGTFILTPWLQLSGRSAEYMDEEDTWEVFDGAEIDVNLSTGEGIIG